MSGCRKRKAARHLGLPNKVELQQLVQRLERCGLRDRRGGRRKLGLERIASHRSALQHEPRSVRQESELLGQRGSDRRRHVEICGREVRTACAALTSKRPGELLQIERVATALLEKRGHSGRVECLTEELAGLATRQRADLDANQCPDPLRPLERGGHAPRRLAGTDGQRDEHGRSRRPAQQRREQLGRSRVSPVEIIEHEHERRSRRESLEQLAHHAVSAIPLVLEHRSAGCLERCQRGKHVRELAADVVIEGLEATRRKPLDVLVERVDEHPERQIALELRCRPAENEVPTRIGPDRKLREETRLADAWLTHERKRSGPPPVQLGERVIERTARLGAPNEVLGDRDHFRSRRA